MKTTSPEGTKKFGFGLARKVLASSKQKNARDHAFVIALQGELGAGKTTFVQGFAKGLGINKPMRSPTFLILKTFNLKLSNFKTLHHIDAYRIKRFLELKKIGIKKVLESSENIVLIEWPNKFRKDLPKKSLWVYLRHGKKENERIIKMKRGAH